MRYIVNSAELYSQLQNLNKVIVTKNSMLILTCVRFEVSGTTLTMRSTDKEITLTSRLQLIDSSGDSCFAINANQLIDILKQIPEQPITLDVNTSTLQIDLSYQNGHMVFQGESAEDFPELTRTDVDSTSFSVPSATLTKGLANAVVATADNNSRIAMQGILFDVNPGEFVIVASDGRKLVKSLIHCDTGDVTAYFILPQKPLGIIRSVLDKANVEVSISTNTAGNATFCMGDYTMYCRLVTETYPNYRKVIPEANDRIATIDRASLTNALRRLAVIADKSTCLIKLQFEADKLTLSTENNNYAQSGEEHIMCQYDSMPIKIGFQGNILLDLLSRINSDEIMLKLSDPSRAGILLPTSQDEDLDILMLVMPLLITN